MVRFPSELIEEAAKLAHAEGKGTSTWIRDLVRAEIFIRKHQLAIDWEVEGAMYVQETPTGSSGFPVRT